MFLDDTTFKTVSASTPLISIDLVVKNTQCEYLLGYRNNRLAQRSWFFPGGQVLKDETMDDAFILLCMDELGVTLPGNKWFFFFYGFTVDINLVKLHRY
jgi:colanic acid biosynthesis protein WcaH